VFAMNAAACLRALARWLFGRIVIVWGFSGEPKYRKKSSTRKAEMVILRATEIAYQSVPNQSQIKVSLRRPYDSDLVPLFLHQPDERYVSNWIERIKDKFLLYLTEKVSRSLVNSIAIPQEIREKST